MPGPEDEKDREPKQRGDIKVENKARKFAEELAKEGDFARGEAEAVARELLDERVDDAGETSDAELFEVADFNARLDFLRKHFEKREKISEADRHEYVLTARRRFIELRFLLWYARDNLLIEQDQNGHEIYREREDSVLDLTEADRFVDEVEAGIKTITEKTDHGEESIYEGIETQLATIKPKDFLKLPIERRLLLVSNIKSWDELKNGGLLVFHFGGNTALEYQIGLGDLMPPQYRSMTLGETTYQRRGNQGFYHNGNYLAIFTGTRVTVGEKDENYFVEKEYAGKFGDAYKGDESKVDSPGGQRELTRQEILEVARNFSVDAYLLQAVLAIVESDSANDINDDYEFLHIAARYLQNAEMRYESAKGTCLKDKHYTAEFIAYALDRFNLFADYDGQSDDVVRTVIERYASLSGIKLDFDERVQKLRVESKPKTFQEYVRGGPGAEASGSAEIAGEMPQGGSGVEILDDPNWRREYYESLRARGISQQEAKMAVLYTEFIYGKMRERMGSAFESQVNIRNYDGSDWTIKNSCVGGIMKNFEMLPFEIVRGRQAGKNASAFYWGTYRDGSRDFRQYCYLRTLVSSDSHVIKMRVGPGNVDELIGPHLAPGECAPAGLWNHALWIYKRLDGTVMIAHSGADVRPQRIAVGSVDEPPAGYIRQGSYYVKQRGSKFNELPLRDFLARRQSVYPAGTDRSEIAFVPMSTLVSDNMAARGERDFLAFYERNKSKVDFA